MVAAVEDNNGRMGTEGNQKNTQTEQDEEKVDEDDDDERPCHVCGEYEADDPNNLLLMCDGCDVPVHQDCYGVEEVPEGDWFCHACKGAKEGKNVEVTKLRCELCITHGVGAFTPVARSTGTVDTTAAGNRQDSAGEKGGNGNPDLKTADGGPSKKKSNSSGKSGNGNGDKWCHTACAFWVHETFFPDRKPCTRSSASTKYPRLGEIWCANYVGENGGHPSSAASAHARPLSTHSAPERRSTTA
eukprot:CAMPEP_0117748642 /NCGR_PEP_ID=MMETSP0947-20121206/9261_1 /TAXON_ID=44440 /ORGANISM="Chattonella subsalsa, Strain CCMP2191" /LENGTH=243 /DNA_ID=CAMNT_0005566391 /DNA_START=41 /DNA_END=769 /DNA_ORIENTATION=+